MKKILLLFFIIITTSCDSSREKHFSILEGEWQSVKFYCNGKDLSKNTYIVNFYDPSHFHIVDFSDTENDFITSEYNIIEDANTLKMDIECEDKSLNGNYNVYIDTIGEDIESYHIRLTLDTEKNYIQAIRHKLKHSFPQDDKKSISEKKN